MSALSSLELIYCALVLLAAYGLRGSTGFGGSLGMPLLALVVPIKILVPAWTLLGLASSIAIIGKDRQHIAMKKFLVFIPWCALGVVVGLYFFATLDSRTLLRALGVMVVGYAAYFFWTTLRPAAQSASSISPSPANTASRFLGPLAAWLAGVVGALFGAMATVFFAMYLDVKTMPKMAFRATVSAMLLTLCIGRGLGYWAVGDFTRDVWIAFAMAFPLMLLGIWIGDRIHVRLSELAFKRLVCAVLFACGVPLLLR
jgi:uncharacterized membrane protein YfcA